MNRRRWLVGVLITLAVLVGALVAGAMSLSGILRWAAVNQLAKATGRAVTLESVDLSLARGRLALRGLRIADRDGAPLLALDRADVAFSPRALLRLRGHIGEATLQGVSVRVVRTGPNEFNVSDLLGRRAEKGGQAPAVTIDRFALVGASVVIEDRTLTPPRTWRVDPLEIRAHGVSTVPGAPPGQASLIAVAAGSPITLSLTDVRLAPPAFKGTLSVSEVDATLAALYMPPASPLTPARGRLTISASMDHDAANGSRLSMDAGFASVELSRPGQESTYLTAPAVRVTVDDLRLRPGGVMELGRLAVDGGSMTLEDTRLQPARRWQVDGISVEATKLSSARGAPPGVATARASTSGARLDVWGTGVRLAPLEMHATVIVRNVDLGLVQLYLPASLPVRPERGVVNATVRVDHDSSRGTRLGLDAGLANIELQRPQHWVTAPAVRVVVDDVVLHGTAVAVGKVAVTSDRLTLEERTAKPVRTWAVKDFVVEAKDLSSRRDAVQGVASLRAGVAGATVAVFVTGARLQPLELRATAILRSFDAALARFYLPDTVPVELRRGVVNATFEVTQTAEAMQLTGDATLTGLQADGRDGLAAFGVTAPSVRLAIAEARRQGQALSVGRIELSGAGSLTDSRDKAGRFDFSRIQIATENLTWPVTAPARVEASLRFQDRGELDGRGTARLTAPPPTVAWDAELALKFRGVDLAPLAAYVPAAAGLGGRVRADVTANLAYAGSLKAQVRGEVAGARFALAEGERTLLSLRGIVASGLDLQWPERMGMKRLRLREPYAFVTRDREGRFPLLALATARKGDAPAPAPAAPKRALPSIAVDEVVVEDGRAAFVDEGATPPVRVDLPRLALTARNVTWPATAPVTVALESTLPSGGTLKVDGKATAEPPSVDLTIACRDADLAPLQPYLGFRARVAGRFSANLAVSGPLTPAPRVKITGDAGLGGLDVTDGQRSVLTADRLRVTGIDAEWPTRIAFDRVRVRRAWAQIERGPQGDFLLRNLFERPGPAGPSRATSARVTPPTAEPAPPAPGSAAPPQLEVSFREGIFEEQAATIVDAAVSPPVRLEVAGARLAVRDFTLPQRAPIKVELKSPMPGGGTVDVAGTVQLAPMRVETRAVLDGVAIDPLQQYVPIEGRATGKVTGDLTVKLALDPLAIQVGGQARLQSFRLHDGDRAVITVGRLETAGLDVDWPRRVAVESVKLRRPRLLVERDDTGEFRLRRLVTPRWATVPPAARPSAASVGAGPPGPAAKAPAATGPTVEVATLSLEKALARFVDYTTQPNYSEELEDLDVTLSPLSTVPGRRTRFALAGALGGGTVKIQGEAAYGERSLLELKLDVRNYIVPRANPYLAHYTGWAASSGSLDVTGVYKLAGTQLETRHDVVARGLDVGALDDRDEVARRVGLPFGLLVSLLKDARGEIKLSLPVSGDLATREFDYREALWSSVRSFAVRVVALPFSKIGSLFFSQDAKVKAVALAPVVFEPGTDRFGANMEPHLQRVADFLRGSPAVTVTLEPVLVEPDVQSLKRAQLLAHLGQSGEGDVLERAGREHRLRWPDRPLPPTLEAIVAALTPAEPLGPEALRTLATRRLDAVRQFLTRGGGVDPARLPGTARRTPLVEAAGQPRVEFDLRGSTEAPSRPAG